MSSYITNSECGGHRPTHLGSGQYFSRTNLVAALLRRRHAARFVVAPPCFGKTILVAEYAKSVFAFESTFWIRAQSPSFIRDLDKNEIAPSIVNSGLTPGLVIFDDVPRMAAKRAKVFSQALDQLMESGWEVILTMTPASDTYSKLQSDRVLIESKDLLVSDEEIIHIRNEADLERKPPTTYHQIERIPCFFWQTDTPIENTYKRLLSEDLPSEMQLHLFVLLMLGEGSLEQLDRFISSSSQKTLFQLERYYLYLGVDIQEGLFSTYLIPVKDIAKRFLSLLDRVAQKSLASTKDDLVAMIADALIERGNPQRACQTVRLLSSIACRKAWLESQNKNLFRLACFFEAYLVYESLGLSKARETPALVASHVWRLHYLGDTDAALRLAGRVVNMSAANEEERTSAALFLTQEGNEASQERAYEQLNELASFSENIDEYLKDDDVYQVGTEKEEDWHALAVGNLCIHHSIDRGLAYLLRPQNSIEVVMALATRLLRSLRGIFDPHKLSEGEDLTDVTKCDEVIYRSIEFIKDLDASSDVDEPTFMHVLLFRNLDEAIRVLTPHRRLEISRAYRLAIHRVEMLAFAQKNSYEQVMREAEATKQDLYSTEGSPTEKANVLPPIMRVKLFGGVDIAIGDQRVSPNLLNRQKDKTLLALLILNKGKEISRERLLESLWPNVHPKASLRNFYAVWSRLRKSLTTPSGDCPYLVRLQNSCMVDADLVQSDVAEFDEMCRKLSFGSADVSVWEHYYEQLSGLYTDDLMPGEYENEIVINARNEYRDRMVDACVTGANYLIERGRNHAALWFARLAAERDRTREDAYEALMVSQLGAGQRTAALGTFHKCKGYLAEELGIDPPARLVALFDRITNEDPMLATLGTKRHLIGELNEV